MLEANSLVRCNQGEGLIDSLSIFLQPQVGSFCEQGLDQAGSNVANGHLEATNNTVASMSNQHALPGGPQAPPSMDPAVAMQRATVSEESAQLELLALLAAGDGFGSTTAGGAGANEWAWPRSAADPHSRAISPSHSHHLTAIQLALLNGPIAGSSGDEDHMGQRSDAGGEEEEEEELLRQLSGRPCTAPLAPPSASSNMRDGTSIVVGVGGSFTSDTAAARAPLRSPPQLNLPPFPGKDTAASAQKPPSPPALTYTTSAASAQPPIPRIRRVESIESVGTVEGEPPSPSLSGLSPSASGLPSRQASTASLAATTSTWTAKVQPGVTKSW